MKLLGALLLLSSLAASAGAAEVPAQATKETAPYEKTPARKRSKLEKDDPSGKNLQAQPLPKLPLAADSAGSLKTLAR